MLPSALNHKVRDLLEDLLPPLNHLFSSRMLHRDIKPDNVMVLRENGCARIIDLGSIASLDDRHSWGGGGSMLFQPPEVLRNDHGCVLQPSQDLYALGVVLYQALCGITCHPYLTYEEILQCLELEGEQEPRRCMADLVDQAPEVHWDSQVKAWLCPEIQSFVELLLSRDCKAQSLQVEVSEERGGSARAAQSIEASYYYYLSDTRRLHLHCVNFVQVVTSAALDLSPCAPRS
jgi:serine/threonine protein kinase